MSTAAEIDVRGIGARYVVRLRHNPSQGTVTATLNKKGCKWTRVEHKITSEAAIAAVLLNLDERVRPFVNVIV